MLGRIFGAQSERVTGDWLHNGALRSLQHSPYVTEMIKSKSMRQAGQVNCMGNFDVLLTVHLSIILVTDQLNAPILVL